MELVAPVLLVIPKELELIAYKLAYQINSENILIVLIVIQDVRNVLLQDWELNVLNVTRQWDIQDQVLIV